MILCNPQPHPLEKDDLSGARWITFLFVKIVFITFRITVPQSKVKIKEEKIGYYFRADTLAFFVSNASTQFVSCRSISSLSKPSNI
jgi:hypothetical protein